MGLIKYVIHQADFDKLLNAPWVLRDRLLFRLLYFTGIRTTELCTMKMEHVDLANKTIKILDSKKHEFFVIPIDTKTNNLLAEYITRKSGWLFPSKASGSGHLTKEGINWILKYYASRIDLDPDVWHPRQFRRRIARYWVKKKGDLTALQQLLRHTHFESTAKYIDGIRFGGELRTEYDAVMEE